MMLPCPLCKWRKPNISLSGQVANLICKCFSSNLFDCCKGYISLMDQAVKRGGRKLVPQFFKFLLMQIYSKIELVYLIVFPVLFTLEGSHIFINACVIFSFWNKPNYTKNRKGVRNSKQNKLKETSRGIAKSGLHQNTIFLLNFLCLQTILVSLCLNADLKKRCPSMCVCVCVKKVKMHNTYKTITIGF